MRAEFRRDWSTERFFLGRLGAADLHHGQNTALVGGVWWFGTKKGTWQEDGVLLAVGMVLLGVATFVALVAFVELCDRV